MTGPEHYREAEKYLAVLDTQKDPQAWAAAVGRGDIAVGMLAGMVHATLALAAATAQSGGPGSEASNYGEWREVTRA